MAVDKDPDMDRILTIQQPWADLIMAGVKDVENRTWPVPATVLGCPACGGKGGNARVIESTWAYSTCAECDDSDEYEGFPLRLGIHAAKRTDRSDEALEAWGAWAVHCEGTMDDVSRGVLLGSVMVIGCHHANECGYGPLDGAGNYAGPEQWCSRWAQQDVFHWEFAAPEPLAVPVPMTGRLGLWTADLADTR